MISAPRKHSFSKRKYGRPLLVDCVHFSHHANPVALHQPFYYDFHGVFIQRSGTVEIAIENEPHVLTGGNVIFLRAFQVREYRSASEDFAGYLVIFEDDFVTAFFRDALFVQRFQFFDASLPPILDNVGEHTEEYVKLCQSIRSEIRDLQDDSHHYIRSLIYNLFIQLNRVYTARYALSAKLFSDDVSLRFRKLVEDNVDRRLSVDEYARLLQLNRSTLHNALMRVVGKPASVMIRERLLIEVKRRLLYSEANVSQIADALGFSDASNFTRFFKSHAGQTPRAFRTAATK